MTRSRLDSLLLFLLGCVIFVWSGFAWERTSPVAMVDFKGAYYSARCLLQGLDPYNHGELLRVYQMEGGDHASDLSMHRSVVELNEHMPTTFILTLPFAFLAWGPAHLLWMVLTAACFIVAAYLMWSLAEGDAPVAVAGVICLFLFNSELLLEIGNAAGISVSLCVIAAWCFVKERFAPLGVLCLAVSLAVTPHDAGLVWLYFLLAGGLYRKRALQTMAVTVVLGLPMILWVTYVAPHWSTELLTNLQMGAAHGAPSDPGPAVVDPRFPGALIIDLQSAFSLFRDDPHFYEPAAYMVSVPLILVWAFTTLRKRISQESTWLALASISALSMLPLYHRTHDTRLLLLTIPALALLWAKGGPTKWLAFALACTDAVFIGVLPERLLAIYSTHLRESTHGLAGMLLALLFTRPVPLILLITGIFYLWIYVRRSFTTSSSGEHAGSRPESSHALSEAQV